MHHSPRDRVFRLLKVGHLSNSLLRTTFILHTKEYLAKNGSNSNNFRLYKVHISVLFNRKNKTNITIPKNKMENKI
jgi:hypothetical protein